MTIDALERQARREAFATLVSATTTLRESVEAAVTRPADDLIDGWRIVRVPLAEFGVEIRLAESLREHVTYTMPSQNAQTVVLTVKRGRLRITYEGLDNAIEVEPNSPPVILPSGIGRTTFVSEHPCTVFCVILGGASRGSLVDS